MRVTERALRGIGELRSPQVQLAVLGAAAASAAGWATARGSPLFAAPIIGAAGLVVLAYSVQAPFAAVVVAASTFSSAYALPKIAHLYPAEMLTLLGVASLALSRYRRLGGKIGALLLILLVAVFGGIEVARLKGIATLTAIDQARPMVLYAAFWLALAALRASPRRFFVVASGAAASITALSIAQFALPNHHLFLNSGLSIVTPEPGGFTRVRPPGLVLVYFALIFAASYLLWGPRRGRASATALGTLLGIGILLSLNRNMIVGLGLGLLAALVASRRRGRAAVLLGTAVIMGAATLTFVGSGAIGARILSLGNPSGLEKTTLSDRQYENRKAVPVIEHHVLFGIGWAASYGAVFALPSGKLIDRSFIHNQYYGLWLRTGLLGLLAYLGLLVTSALYAIRWMRHRAAAPDAWLGQAVLASMVAFAASSIVGIYVIDAGSTPAVAGLFAVAALLHERIGQRNPLFLAHASTDGS